MPDQPYQKPIEADSLPLPEAWAETITLNLKDYWKRQEAAEKAYWQLEACELDDGLGDEFEDELQRWEDNRG